MGYEGEPITEFRLQAPENPSSSDVLDRIFPGIEDIEPVSQRLARRRQVVTRFDDTQWEKAHIQAPNDPEVSL